MVTDLVNQIRAAHKEFGRYTYYDKGPGEVMDIHTISTKIKEMDPKEARDVLAEVKKYKNGGYDLVSSVLCELQELPDEQFNILAESMPEGW